MILPASWVAVKSVVCQNNCEGLTGDDLLRCLYGGGEAGDQFSFQREQRAAEAAERAARGEFTLSQLLNQIVIDPDRGVVGRLTSQLVGGTRQYRLVDETGRKWIIATARRLLDPRSGNLFTVGPIFGERNRRDFSVNANTLSEGQLNSFLESLGLGVAGGGVSADTAASIASREREAAAERAHELELERLQAENAMKRARLGEAGSLARTAAEVQQRARQLIAELTGVDPIRGAVAAQGGVQRGTTPAQAFGTQLQGIANAPLPTVSEEASIPEIEQTIQTLQGQQQLPIAPSLGFAHGGTIEMTRGEDGVFSAARGTTKRAILTGEGGGISGDEEVIILDSANPGRTEVIPLVSAAQAGGTFDVGTIRGALAPVFGSLGFGDIPTAARSPFGFSFAPVSAGGRTLAGSQVLPSLGYNPRLLRNAQTGATYFRTPRGELQYISSPEAFGQAGFQWGDVLNVASNELDEFGINFGTPFTRAPEIESGVRRFPTRSIPLLTPPAAGNIALPAIGQLAGIWRFLDPATRNVIVSAYGVAGLGTGTPEQTQQDIEEEIRFFTPRGSQRVAGGARLG